MSQWQSYDRAAKKPANYAALNEGTIPYPVANEAAGGMATQGDGNWSEPATEEIATDSDMSEEKLAKLVEETQQENERLQKQLVFQQKLQELEALKQENQRLAAEISALQWGQRIGGTAGNSNTRATAVAGDHDSAMVVTIEPVSINPLHLTSSIRSHDSFWGPTILPRSPSQPAWELELLIPVTRSLV